MEQITFEAEDGQSVNLSILEETVFGGKEYILVTEAVFDESSEEGFDEEVEVFPLRLRSEEGADGDVVYYETIDDDAELQAVSEIFNSLLAEDGIEIVE